jgi:hypothetical protein
LTACKALQGDVLAPNIALVALHLESPTAISPKDFERTLTLYRNICRVLVTAIPHIQEAREAANEPASADNDLSPEQSAAITTFVLATRATFEAADSYLSISDWNFDTAVSKFWANQTVAITDRPTNHIHTGHNSNKRQALSSMERQLSSPEHILAARLQEQQALHKIVEQTQKDIIVQKETLAARASRADNATQLANPHEQAEVCI